MSFPEFQVALGPKLPSPDPYRQFKHLRRSEWLEPLRNARNCGFHEVILFDEQGHLVEAAVSNVFFIWNGIIHTPALSLGALPGIARSQVLRIAREYRWPVIEGHFTAIDMAAASEVWLSNSLIEVRPVSQLGGQQLPKARPHYDELMRIWRKART